MSNINTGCFSIFKKSQSRESNDVNGHVRRSRASFGMDPLSYLRPNGELPEKNEYDEKAKLTKDFQKTARDEDRLTRQKTLSMERSLRKPKEKTLEQRKKDSDTVLNTIYGTGKRTGSGTGSGIGKRVETGTGLGLGGKLETGIETGAITGTGKGKGAGKGITGKVGKMGKTAKTTTEVAESEDVFKQNIEILEQQIDNLDLRSKMMATMWLNRLRAPAENEEEIVARNLITAHLIKCRNENIFQRAPFNLPPTSDTLANIKQKMFLTRDTPCYDTTLANRMETKAYLNKLFHDSYDDGEFLAKLPVPRDGAFFIQHMRPNL